MTKKLSRYAILRKIFSFQLSNSRAMADELARGRIRLMERDEYVDVIVRQLEVIPPETVIQRLTGDGARDSLLGPMWSLKKFEVLNAIDRAMAERDTWQGRLLTKV